MTLKVRRGTIASNSKCYPKLAGLHPQAFLFFGGTVASCCITLREAQVMRDTDLSLHRKALSRTDSQ